jgi:DNA-binding XRE family transcriptional regulator
MNVQIIEKSGKPEWVVISYEDYEDLLERAEMADDVCAYDEAKKALVAGEELIPAEVTFAILDGASPVRVWRDQRGFTQQQLAQVAGISVPYLSQIEAGKRTPSATVLAALAKALDLTVDDIISG